MNTKQQSSPDPKLLYTLSILPIVIALVIAWLLPREPLDPVVQAAPSMQQVQAANAARLESIFAEYGYTWPPDGAVPPLAVTTFPEDMVDLDTEERRALFFRTLLPLAMAENERMLRLREEVTQLESRLQEEGREPDAEEQDWLRSLFEHFRLSGDPMAADDREALLRRMDVIPVSLALAQAANESGWGTSRFTREANNLFGEWTWTAETGLLPERRAEGATHFVRSFPTLAASVRSYVRNLNSHPAYQPLRDIRTRLRANDQEITGTELAAGLERYSERGEAYIREIRAMIRQNRLEELEPDLELEQ